MDIGKKLCERRRELGLSQTELAEALKVYGVNVTNQAVSKWENGSADPSTTNLLALAKLYGVPAEELIRGVEANPAAGKAERGAE